MRLKSQHNYECETLSHEPFSIIRLKKPITNIVHSENIRLTTVYVPNQPHLLNKYQINLGFSHFHEIGILSRMYYILAPHQIDIVKGGGFCNGSIIFI